MNLEKGRSIDMLNQHLDKVLLFFIFAFSFTSNLILLAVPPIEKYEISIYMALPLHYWILITASIVLCILVIIRSDKNLYFYLAFAGIIINYIVLIFLSFIRGYFQPVDGAWDVYYHLAQLDYIESEGQIWNNRYPMLHIIMMVIRASSGMINESMSVSSTLAVFQILFLVISLYAVKIIFNDQRVWMVSFLFFVPFLLGKFHTVLMPYQCALVMLLLYVSILFKVITSNGNKKYSIPLIVIGASLVFFHPLVSLFSLLSTFAIILGVLTYSFICPSYNWNKTNISCYFLNILILLFLIFIIWLITANLLRMPVISIYEFLQIQDALDMKLMEDNIAFIADPSTNAFYKIYRSVRIYGSLMIYFLMGSFGALCVLHRTIMKKSSVVYFNLLLQAGIALGIGLLLLTGNFIVGEVERSLGFLIILTPLLCGVFYKCLLSKYGDRNNLIKCFVFLIVVFSTVLGVFGIYYSPSNSIANPMVSYSDKSGIEFTYTHLDENIPIIANVNNLGLWPSYIFGITSQHYNININSTFPPSHFGYEKYDSIGNIFENENYLMTNERLKQNHLGHRKEVYSDEDFARLGIDKSIVKIYSSDVFELWIINPR